MNKQDYQKIVAEIGSSRILSEGELLQAYRSGVPQVASGKDKSSRLIKILYYIGGLIVFLGLVVFVFQMWNSLNTTTRVLVTLGSAIASYVVAVLLDKDKRLGELNFAFFLIYGLLLPTGIFVTFHEGGLNITTAIVNAFMSFIVLVAHLVSYAIFRKKIFIVLSVIFGTWFFFSLTNFLGAKLRAEVAFYEYRALLVGLSYLLLGYYFSNKIKGLTSWLYSFGCLGFLGSTLALGGWSPDQNIFWEAVAPLFIFGVIYLSIYLKHRSFLFFGTLFLVLYVLKITGEYFADSMSWPVALVASGLMIIAIAYGAFYLNNRYLKKTEQSIALP